ncbi:MULTISPECIES: YqaA family protein [unclassified Halomonas]|uniref:YqaA family protein n=1 Tax=unclassified Halomonas TaxID=2609666 RepID=UPI0020A129BD|nr:MULTISPECIES: DedA family protein [unclassified Halomonas]MCP1313681.1 DedA family protein [Halomonas sp. 707D7]MCP1326042.1 DedA family protein [Halomonas sp. 707D4]
MVLFSHGHKQWLTRLNRSRRMLWLLGALSFLETLILPVPLELIIIPLMASNRARIWSIAAVVTAGCLLGSLAGYGIGMALFQSLGTWLIGVMGIEQSFQSFQTFFSQYGFAAIVAIGILPIPYQVALITAGLSGYPILLFLLAALLSRGVRYFGIAWLVYRFGHEVERMWKRHALMTSLLGGALILVLVLGMQLIASRLM